MSTSSWVQMLLLAFAPVLLLGGLAAFATSLLSLRLRSMSALTALIRFVFARSRGRCRMCWPNPIFDGNLAEQTSQL